MKILGGATTSDSSIKPYKASKMKKYFPFDRFDTLNAKWLFSKLKNSIPLNKKCDGFQKSLNIGLIEEQSMNKHGM